LDAEATKTLEGLGREEAMKTLEGLGRESEGTLGNAFEKRKIAFLVMNTAAMFLSFFFLNIIFVFDQNVCSFYFGHEI